MKESWIKWPLAYFALVAIWGTIMRAMPVFGWSGFDYEHLLHAHSHLALLGWAYFALFLLLADAGYRNAAWPRALRWNFIAAQAVTVGMFIAFNLQGYAFFSILFSTLHILLSYHFLMHMWKRFNILKTAGMAEQPRGTRQERTVGGAASNHQPSAAVLLYWKGALAAMGLSSIGPWSLAVIAANGLEDSPFLSYGNLFLSPPAV